MININKKQKIIVLFLVTIFLCGCTNIEITDTKTSSISQPSTESVPKTETNTEPSQEVQHGGIYEKDGKYYLDLTFKPEYYADPLAQYSTEIVCSSLEELLEKWHTCTFTEKEMFGLAYTAKKLSDLNSSIQIMNPDDLFYPVDDDGSWENAVVVWNPLEYTISFKQSQDDVTAKTEQIILYYTEQCENLTDVADWYWVLGRNHFLENLDHFAKPSYPGGGTLVNFGDKAFLNCETTHYHHQGASVDGRVYYLCIETSSSSNWCTLFTIYNGYCIAGYCVDIEGYNVQDHYEILLDPLIYTDFKDYSVANNS